MKLPVCHITTFPLLAGYFKQKEQIPTEEPAGKGGGEKMAEMLDSQTGWLVVTNIVMGLVLVPLFAVALAAMKEIIGRRQAAQ